MNCSSCHIWGYPSSAQALGTPRGPPLSAQAPGLTMGWWPEAVAAGLGKDRGVDRRDGALALVLLCPPALPLWSSVSSWVEEISATSSLPRLSRGTRWGSQVGQVTRRPRAGPSVWDSRVCVLSCFGCVRLFVTLWTVARQAPLSMAFSRQKYWSGLLSPLAGDLPDSGIKPAFLTSPALAGRFFTASTMWEVQVGLRWSIAKETCSPRARNLSCIPRRCIKFLVCTKHRAK